MENQFEKIANYLCNSWLDNDILNQEDYAKADAEVDRMQARLNEAGVSTEVMEVIDDCIESYINLMTLNIKLAYKQGMKDLAAFIAGLYNVDVAGQHAAASEKGC